jgi:hypothetical protein
MYDGERRERADTNALPHLDDVSDQKKPKSSVGTVGDHKVFIIIK